MQTWLTFTKEGNMRLLSHLDVTRLFRKAIRRAKIDVLYTEGFNPQQRLAVTNPLPLGFQSRDEKMAIETETPFTEEKRQALNAQLPAGIQILSFEVPEDGADLHTLFPFSTYAIRGLDDATMNQIIAEVEAMKGEGEVIWERVKIKKGKKKIQKKDLLPSIGAISKSGELLLINLGAHDAKTLRPNDFMTYLQEHRGVVLPEYLQYSRLRQLKENDGEIA